MGSTIGFFCGNEDTKSLQEFGESIGLVILAPRIDKEFNVDPWTSPYCFFSTVAPSELHPFGTPPVRLTDAKDPLLRFMRGYHLDQYLVAGHIYWSNDVPSIAHKTKPYYQSLTKWIKKNWKLLPGGGFYIGPEAELLVEKGAEMVNVLPEQATFKIVTN